MKAKIQKNESTFPKSHSYQSAGLDLNPRLWLSGSSTYYIGSFWVPVKASCTKEAGWKVKHLVGKYAVEKDVNPLLTLSYIPLRNAKHLAS